MSKFPVNCNFLSSLNTALSFNENKWKFLCELHERIFSKHIQTVPNNLPSNVQSLIQSKDLCYPFFSFIQMTQKLTILTFCFVQGKDHIV